MFTLRLAALALATTPFLSTVAHADDLTLPTFLERPAYDIDPKEPALTRLLKEHRNAARDEARGRFLAYHTGRGDLLRMTDACTVYAASLLELVPEKDRADCLKELDELCARVEDTAAKQLMSGTIPQRDLQHVRRWRLGFQIRAEREKAKAAGK
jgi:hypothetical protein